MKVTVTLDHAASIALRRLAHERRCSEDEAAAHAIRDALIAAGLLEFEDEEDPARRDE